jgi:hypothetical protein
LATLTGLDPKPAGIYYVLQDGTPDRDFLTALRHTGDALKSAGLETILAYAGPELVPLLASGSWEVAVTGPMASQRRTKFERQTGGPTRRQLKRWLLISRLLEDMKDQDLQRVASIDAGLIPCGCSACASLFSTGTLVYDRDKAERHYVAAVNRIVSGLRQYDPTNRPPTLRTALQTAIARADTIDQTPPLPTRRLSEKARLDPWIDTLLL